MRVLLGIPWYFPASVGGTEIYVRGLARQLRDGGVDVAIAVPTTEHQPTKHFVDGVPVFQYPAPYATAGEIDLSRLEPQEWCDVLDSFAPSVVDFHSFTSGLELAHLRAAKRRGVRTVVTLHVPGVICARGTMMRFGDTPCSGDIVREPCTACRLQMQGVPVTLGRMLAGVPRWIANVVESSSVPAAARRAFTAASRDADRRQWLDHIVVAADRIVSPSGWLVDVLLRNGVPRDKIVLCRQGVDLAHVGPARGTTITTPLKVGFVGRYDPVKGLHTLIDAAVRVPAELALEVHVWGVARLAAEQRYREEMIQRANGTARVIFHLETARPAEIYRNIHALAVPSEWFETGPLVVLEAQAAAALPVIGSNLGGIAERVTDGENGILVPFGDVAALTQALTTLARDPSLLIALRPTRPPRTIADVARETLLTYEALADAHAA